MKYSRMLPFQKEVECENCTEEDNKNRVKFDEKDHVSNYTEPVFFITSQENFLKFFLLR